MGEISSYSQVLSTLKEKELKKVCPSEDRNLREHPRILPTIWRRLNNSTVEF